MLILVGVINAECYMQALYADCHYAECCFAECRGANLKADILKISYNNLIIILKVEFVNYKYKI
jgi:hypothetical protein